MKFLPNIRYKKVGQSSFVGNTSQSNHLIFFRPFTSTIHAGHHMASTVPNQVLYYQRSSAGLIFQYIRTTVETCTLHSASTYWVFMRFEPKGHIVCSITTYAANNGWDTISARVLSLILSSTAQNKYLQQYSFEALNSSVLM